MLSKLDDVLFLYDQHCHSSIVSAIKSVKVKAESFAHNDMTDLAAKLDRNFGKQVVVIAEGLYSADGDFIDLIGLASLKRSFGFLLYVDEAHSFVLSEAQRNVLDRFAYIDGNPIDVITGSLSKALCSTGGFAVGSEAFIAKLKMSREYIFSTGLTPSILAASLSCLELLAETDRHKLLAQNIQHFRKRCMAAEINLGESDTPSPIFTIFPKGSCVELYQALMQQGILVQPLLYPAVPKESERLRVMINAAHSGEQIEQLIDAINH